MMQRCAHLRDEALKRGADVAGDLFTALAQAKELKNKGGQSEATGLTLHQ
jgi:hypothetical protein